MSLENFPEPRARRSKSEKPSTKEVKLRVLPLTAEVASDPVKMQRWLFSHTAIVMQGIFVNLEEASPNDRLRTLKDLMNMLISFKPTLEKDEKYVSEYDLAGTHTDILAQLINEPIPESIKSEEG